MLCACARVNNNPRITTTFSTNFLFNLFWVFICTLHQSSKRYGRLTFYKTISFSLSFLWNQTIDNNAISGLLFLQIVAKSGWLNFTGEAMMCIYEDRPSVWAPIDSDNHASAWPADVWQDNVGHTWFYLQYIKEKTKIVSTVISSIL